MPTQYVYVDDECGITTYDQEVHGKCPICGCERELIEENELEE